MPAEKAERDSNCVVNVFLGNGGGGGGGGVRNGSQRGAELVRLYMHACIPLRGCLIWLPLKHTHINPSVNALVRVYQHTWLTIRERSERMWLKAE